MVNSVPLQYLKTRHKNNRIPIISSEKVTQNAIKTPMNSSSNSLIEIFSTEKKEYDIICVKYIIHYVK